MFQKILVANRGEIAIRAFRAAFELGARTVAVFPYEDRNSLHRLKADEAYQIGTVGHPVRAYLDVAEIIRVAKDCGADAIYPGYGFLSENPELAAAAAEAGITFIGPSEKVLQMAGNKVTAKKHAEAGGVPVLASTPASQGHRRTSRRRRGDRLPDLREGGRRRRRPRDAPGGLEGRTARRPGSGHARGGQRVRRPDDVPGTGGAAAPAHRGADPRGRRRRDHAPLRAGLLRAAAQPEGHRDRAGPEPRRGHPAGAVPRCHRVREVDRLRQRRHGRVPGRHGGGARRAARVHRDEPAHPGRTHRHGGSHRRRSRAGRRCGSRSGRA